MKLLVIDGGSGGFRPAIVDGDNITVLKKGERITTPQELVNLADSRIAYAVDDIKKEEEFDGVAFALAGEVADHRTIVKSSNQPFLNGVNLAELTSKQTALQTVVTNDMEAAGTGMIMMFPELPLFGAITWSGGLGFRLIVDGKIFGASEAGHMQTCSSMYAPICGCGRRGCAEAIVGGLAMNARILEATRKIGMAIPSDKSPDAFLDERYEHGDEWALITYNSLLHEIARFLANLQTTLHLPAIVWKGGVAKAILGKMNKEQDIREAMKGMLFNEEWVDVLKFHYCWDKNPVSNADAFLGAATIWQQTFLK